MDKGEWMLTGIILALLVFLGGALVGQHVTRGDIANDGHFVNDSITYSVKMAYNPSKGA